MSASSERILLVESNPDIQESIVHQVLEPLGYQVMVADDASSAIMLAAKEIHDLAIVDLNLTGLSGKDLLVAFNSQGLQAPVIVIAEKGQENNVIQAFRLGGTDYLLWPAREAEVVAAVERGLREVREKRDREKLDLQLKETNRQLQRRVRELTTIFAIGKAVVSITDQHILFDKIVEAMVYVADADCGWMLLRDEKTRSFNLVAHDALPTAWSNKMGHPLDDGISSLVALSGESLTINGEPLKRFKLSSLGLSAIAVPVKIQQEVIGLLVAVRKADRAFEGTVQSLIEAIADYTAISLVNSHLFRALQDGGETFTGNQKKKVEELQETIREAQALIQSTTYPIELLLTGKIEALSAEQKLALESAQTSVFRALQVFNTIQITRPPAGS